MHGPEGTTVLTSRAIVAALAAFVAFTAGRASAGADPSPPPGPSPSPVASPVVAGTAAPDFTGDLAAAKTYQHKGRYRDAIALLVRDHKLDPANRDVTVALAQSYSFAGDQGQAISLLDELLKAAPDDVDARIFLAQAYAYNHDYAAAEEQYHTALVAAPSDADAQVGLAQTYVFEGRFTEAKALFAQVLAHDSKNMDALVGLAGAEGYGGDYRKARSDYRTVLDAQPENTDALVGLATVEFWLNDVSAAVALDNRALALDPGDADARDLRKQLNIKTSPQLVATMTTSHSNDGSTYDYQLMGRYFTSPSTSIGLVDELYRIAAPDAEVETHRFGVVATYQGPNQFGANLRLVGSHYRGAPSVTDSVLSVNGQTGGLSYGLGTSTGGVEGSIAANGGQTAANQQSALVRINALFGNVGYTRRASSLNLAAQTAVYNDGNHFRDLSIDVSHQFGIGAYTSLTPDIGLRNGGFSDTYAAQSVQAAPGYFDYKLERDITFSVTGERQLTQRLAAGIVATFGERKTVVPIYPSCYPQPNCPPGSFTTGNLPFQRFEPYLDYEGDRFSLAGAIYDDHVSGADPWLQSFAATTIDVTFSIRLP